MGSKEVDPPLPNVDSSGLDDVSMSSHQTIYMRPQVFKLSSKEDLVKAAVPKSGPRIWKLFNVKKTSKKDKPLRSKKPNGKDVD